MNRFVKYAITTGVVAAAGYALYRLIRYRRAKAKETAAAGDAPADPATPLAEPTGEDLDRIINRSTRTGSTVDQSPEELLEQAREHDAAVTMDELTGARLAASEHSRGSFTELCCIVDAELNRAERRGISLYQSLTHEDTFGEQDKRRPASTRLDPSIRHLLAARAVLSGEARGVARGATKFFDPWQMEKSHRPYRKWLEGGRKGEAPKIVSCDALGVLEAWSFDYDGDPKTGNRCPPNRKRRGRDTYAWIGEIAGVDATRLMLMKPLRTGWGIAGGEHWFRYRLAKRFLQKNLLKK